MSAVLAAILELPACMPLFPPVSLPLPPFPPPIFNYHAEYLADVTTTRLLSSRKLLLVLDLDHTLIHATTVVLHCPRSEITMPLGTCALLSSPPVLPSPPLLSCLSFLSPFYLSSFPLAVSRLLCTPCFPSADSHTASSDTRLLVRFADEALVDLGGVWYHIKARRGLFAFLEDAHERFELEVYTFGTRLYADAVVGFIDPTHKYFGDRVVTRCAHSTHALALRPLLVDSLITHLLACNRSLDIPAAVVLNSIRWNLCATACIT